MTKAKKVMLGIFIAIMLVIIGGVIYFPFGVRNAMNSGTIGCGWQDLFEGDCGPDVNEGYPELTEEDVIKILNHATINHDYVSREEALEYIEKRILKINNSLELAKDKDGNKELMDKIRQRKKKQLLRLQSAKAILINL